MKNKKWEERTDLLKNKQWVDDSEFHGNRLHRLGFQNPSQSFHPKLDENDKSMYEQWSKKQKQMRIQEYLQRISNEDIIALPVVDVTKEQMLSHNHFEYMHNHSEVAQIIQSYTNSGYRKYNKLVKEYIEDLQSNASSPIKTYKYYDILLLNAAILNAPNFDDSFSVYRGLHFYDGIKGLKESKYTYGFEEDEETISPGKFLDPNQFPQAYLKKNTKMKADRFLSTTLSPSYAAAVNLVGLTTGGKFIEKPIRSPFDANNEMNVYNVTQRCCFYEIKIPKHYPFLYLQNADRTMDEYEVLLPFLQLDGSVSTFNVVGKNLVVHKMIKNEMTDHSLPTDTWLELNKIDLQPVFANTFLPNLETILSMCNFTFGQIDSFLSFHVTNMLQVMSVLYHHDRHITKHFLHSFFENDFNVFRDDPNQTIVYKYLFAAPQQDDEFLLNFSSQAKLVAFWLQYHNSVSFMTCDVSNVNFSIAEIVKMLKSIKHDVDLIFLWNSNLINLPKNAFGEQYGVFARTSFNGGLEIWAKDMYLENPLVLQRLYEHQDCVIRFCNVQIQLIGSFVSKTSTKVKFECDLVVGQAPDHVMHENGFVAMKNNHLWISRDSENKLLQQKPFTSVDNIHVQVFTIPNFNWKRQLVNSSFLKWQQQGSL